VLAISVENASKVYRLGEINRSQFFGDAKRFLRALARGERAQLSDPGLEASETPDAPDLFWALRDVSFDIRAGETVALIGRNGAGKSTLLKLLSRITAPTRGCLRLKGRIASLLEVGTGFHFELTGRDNVYLSGTIMGMKRAEVRQKFDQIVDFSGLGQFIDTPVKRYSSGMMVRLAFSVAAHLEPEILILDEVLAVGDQQFHNQCIDRIHQIVNQGRTILLVSHSLSYIRRLSNRTIWLRKGEIVEFGPTDRVINAYEAESTVMRQSRRRDEEGKRAVFRSWRLQEGASGESNTLARPGIACSFEFRLDVAGALSGCRLEFCLSDPDEISVFSATHGFSELQTGAANLTISLPSLPLQPGRYRLEVKLLQRHEEIDHWICDPMLVVADSGLHSAGATAGLLALDSRLDVASVSGRSLHS